MKEYIKKDNYTLFLGDVLEVLKNMPSESVDLIFTSPPYNLDLGKRKDTNIATYDTWNDNLDYQEYCDWQIAILDECFRILKKNGQLFYNHKDKFKNEEYKTPIEYLLKSKFKIKQNIIWNRKSALSYNAGMFGDVYENVYWLFKGESVKTKTKHNVLGTIWTIDKETNNDHPAPFPLQLPLRAIYSIYDEEEGKVIMDIFNGSGTTGVASLLLGHKYIGIDISENYLKKSIKRLDNYQKESLKGQEEINNHVVQNGFVSKNKKVSGQSTIFDFIE